MIDPGPSFSALPPPVRVPLVVVPEHACAYLPGRMARTRAFAVGDLPAEVYHRFMDANFRRSGEIIYQPVCAGCRACRQLRVPVARFAASRSQRRCRQRNADLAVSVDRPAVTDEKYTLYQRYLAGRHEPKMSDDRESFESFLYCSPVETVEMCYRDGDGRLLAVGICDVSRLSLSTVYFYFEPESSRRRGLGTFGALFEIELAQRMGVPYYYLGYWVKGCPTMEYKSMFRPCEALGDDGVWREVGE